MPVFVGSNIETEGCVIHQLGDNLFTSLGFVLLLLYCFRSLDSIFLFEQFFRQLIDGKLKKGNPFYRANLVKLKKQLDNWALEHNIPLQNHTMNQRSKKVVARTFYQCGIVVPVDKKTKVGYRDIPESNDKIKKICKKIVDSKTSTEQDGNFDPLQELVRYHLSEKYS